MAGGESAPIQIRAQALRQGHDFALTGVTSGFTTMPDGGGSDPGKAPAHGTGHWREQDVKRAISAAQEAGLSEYSVEIAPDGTIAIVVGPKAPPARARSRRRSAKQPKA